MITQEQLKDRVKCSENGIFIYNRDVSCEIKKGMVAGSVGVQGYLVIGIEGVIYKAHRLVWLYFNGVLPSMELDHIDGNILNNAITNLREVTHSQNQWNRKLNLNSKTKVKGLSYKPSKGRRYPVYQAKIACLGKKYFKSISVTYGRTDEDIIEELTLWLRKTREELHKEFTHHG